MEFMVHKEFACYYSPVFDAAFNSNFIEGQSQIYILDDTTEGAFRLLIQWIYGQKLHIHGIGEISEDIAGREFLRRFDGRIYELTREDHSTSDRSSSEGSDGSQKADDGKESADSSTMNILDDFDFDEGVTKAVLENLFQLWVLADKLSVPQLQNFVLSVIYRVSDIWNWIPSHCAKYTYDKTSHDSPLRKYLVRQCLTNMSVSSSMTCPLLNTSDADISLGKMLG